MRNRSAMTTARSTGSARAMAGSVQVGFAVADIEQAGAFQHPLRQGGDLPLAARLSARALAGPFAGAAEIQAFAGLAFAVGLQAREALAYGYVAVARPAELAP